MADFEDNPFADPGDSNPFQDPSVQQATGQSTAKGLEEYNPFEDGNTQNTQKTTPITAPPKPADTQPAVMKPTSDPPARPPPPYTQSAAQPAMSQAQEDLLRRQEELEKKAAELQRREQQMRSAQYNTRQNNWPPLPQWFPLQPCFYQDFSVDIPLEFQKIVKIGYYLWMAYAVALVLNFIVSLAYFSSGGKSAAGTTFGFAILFGILFTPCSFVCWYRPVYKAFKSDSSFNFFMFFFVFFIQLLVTIVQAIGIDQWGTCGFINGLGRVSEGTVGQKAVGGMMLIMGFLWAVLAVIDTIYLKQVHSLYRTTGANFQKAQEEFARGVVTNPGVQTATKQAASSAISGGFGQPNNQM